MRISASVSPAMINCGNGGGMEASRPCAPKNAARMNQMPITMRNGALSRWIDFIRGSSPVGSRPAMRHEREGITSRRSRHSPPISVARGGSTGRTMIIFSRSTCTVPGFAPRGFRTYFFCV